jgi:hypothetical protein
MEFSDFSGRQFSVNSATKPWQRISLAVAATALTQTLLIVWGYHGIGQPTGDIVHAYHPWLRLMFEHHYILGITHPWVYPFVALVPMLLAWIISPTNFVFGWYVVEVLTQIAAVAIAIGRGSDPKRLKLVFWYLAFVTAIGPVSISRLESFVAPLGLVAVVALLDAHPWAFARLNVISAWMKVAPAMLVLAQLVTSKRRIRVALEMVGVSTLLVAIGLAFGGNLRDIFSFVTDQSNRHVQIESLFAEPSLWWGILHHTREIQFNPKLLTFEVIGKFSKLMINVSTAAMAAGMATMLAIGIRAVKNRSANFVTLAWLSFGLTLTLILFNKVGSPQYVIWLAAPALLVLASDAKGSRMLAWSLLAISLMTMIVFPTIYIAILRQTAHGIAFLTLRNVAELAVWIYVAIKLWRLPKQELELSQSS